MLSKPRVRWIKDGFWLCSWGWSLAMGVGATPEEAYRRFESSRAVLNGR